MTTFTTIILIVFVAMLVGQLVAAIELDCNKAKFFASESKNLY